MTILGIVSVLTGCAVGVPPAHLETARAWRETVRRAVITIHIEESGEKTVNEEGPDDPQDGRQDGK